jgi:subtilisin family serine protease
VSWDRLQQGLVNRALAVLGVAVLAALLVLAGLAEREGRPAGDVVTAADDPAAVTPGAAAGRWITLVSGDRVLVSAQGGTVDVLTVEPAPGRERMTFQTSRADGELYVVPADAVPLLAQGRLDQRLFGVSGLLQFGYDDAGRPDLPLIMTGPGSDAAVARVNAAALRSIDGVAVQQPKDTTADLWATLTATTGADERAAAAQPKVWLDGPVTASLDESVPQVGAPDAWAAGHTGAGAVVAVLDTGIDGTHADLADAVLQAQDFSGSPRGTADFVGHGTHVASIVTGSGTASDGRFQGVAPDAQLLVGKVLDDTGSGYESWIIAGMEWAAAQGADVANLSLGSWLPGTGVEPMDLAVDRLSAETGTLFVVAAGNNGPTAESIASPGSATAALTVGAVDDNDELAPFSSRGPRYQRPAVKPEITAPGVDIVATRAKPSHLGTPVDDAYTRLSGTSMAAPHVAGAAAILAAEHPDWGGEQLKATLVASANPNADNTVFEQGAGRLDVARADRQTVYPTTSEVDGGMVPWPHDDDQAPRRSPSTST